MDKDATRHQRRRSLVSEGVIGGLMAGMLALTACDSDDNNAVNNDGGNNDGSNNSGSRVPSVPLDPQVVTAGQETFRHDTFGDETFWTDVLQINKVI